MMTAGFIWASSQRSPALDQIDNQHHDRNDEQDVNESTQRVGADQSKQPEHQQDHEYCPQHNIPFGWVTCSFVGWGSVALIEIKISAQIAICGPLYEWPPLQFFHYSTQVPVRFLKFALRRLVIAFC
jgi:hypothetical protein